MSRVLIKNLPPETTIRNIYDFCCPYGHLLKTDLNIPDRVACVEYENFRDAQDLVGDRQGYVVNGHELQLEIASTNTDYSVDDNGSRHRNSSPGFSDSRWRANNMESMRRPANNNNDYAHGDDSSIDKQLNYTEACSFVYNRFLREGYDPHEARQKVQPFLKKIIAGFNKGFNDAEPFNIGMEQAGTSSSRNFDFNDFNQGSRNNTQDWDGYNSHSGNQHAQSSRDRPIIDEYGEGYWNNNGANKAQYNEREEPDEIPRNPISHSTYMKSLKIKQIIETKIGMGHANPDIMTDLQFHSQIVEDYEHNRRLERKRERMSPPTNIVRKQMRMDDELFSQRKQNLSNKSQNPTIKPHGDRNQSWVRYDSEKPTTSKAPPVMISYPTKSSWGMYKEEQLRNNRSTLPDTSTMFGQVDQMSKTKSRSALNRDKAAQRVLSTWGSKPVEELAPSRLKSLQWAKSHLDSFNPSV
uniref:RRM domain-containing protein n=1 Tax=Stomoxys calcitrans TaxID=35570 RepID=A0A1I8PMM6_STOCA|nr:unnamed protein product [Stomoxys calcitrans]